MTRTLALFALLAAPAFAATAPEPKVQIAILLDTSSSMDGLINQTKEQLWKIVNTFASAKHDGKKAKLLSVNYSAPLTTTISPHSV